MFQVPVLLLHGQFDPQTSHAFVLYASQNYPKRKQFAVTIPYDVHQTSAQIGFNTTDTNVCGMDVLTSFLLTGIPNTTCTSSVPLPDFDGTTKMSQNVAFSLFGRSSVWGN